MVSGGPHNASILPMASTNYFWELHDAPNIQSSVTICVVSSCYVYSRVQRLKRSDFFTDCRIPFDLTVVSYARSSLNCNEGEHFSPSDYRFYAPLRIHGLSKNAQHCLLTPLTIERLHVPVTILLQSVA